MNLMIKICSILCYISAFSGYLQAQTCASNDSLTLVNFYTNSQGINWAENWDFNQPYSTWWGVEVDNNGCVKKVDLRNIVTGSISADIGYLSNLEELWLSGGDITGGLPIEIGLLQNLRTLYAKGIDGPFQPSITDLVNLERLNINFKYNNNLGPIPSSIGNMTSLKDLALSGSIDGVIPSEIGLLQQLEYLNFQACPISGSIPAEIGQLQNLKKLYMSRTDLSGALPLEIGNMISLEEIIISSNDISGSLPSSLGNLINLRNLNLSNNQITGSIPSEISQLTSLVSLTLRQNLITGSLPAGFQNLAQLSYLNLSDNNHSGDLPDIGTLSNLSVLDLSSNSFSGTLPAEYSNLTNLVKLRIQDNNLSGKIPHTYAKLMGIEKFYIGSNQLSGCFDTALSALCSGSLIIVDSGNNFTPSYAEFCETNIGECACSFDRYLSNSISTGTHKAKNEIISDGVINGTNTQFQAGNSIHLQPSFMTMPNVVFEVSIANCN